MYQQHRTPPQQKVNISVSTETMINVSLRHPQKKKRFTCVIPDMKYYPRHSRKPRRVDAETDSIHPFGYKKQTNKQKALGPFTQHGTYN